jgi:hypothetical protein
MFGVPYQVLMPVMAFDVLGGGANTLGVLMTATGVGALASTTYLASRQHSTGLGRKIAQAAMLFGVALVAFSTSSNLWLSVAILPFAGAKTLKGVVSAQERPECVEGVGLARWLVFAPAQHAREAHGDAPVANHGAQSAARRALSSHQ